MAQLFNNAEGGSDAVAITQGSGGNTGGASGDFFDIVSKGADGVAEFTTTRALQSVAIRAATRTTASAAFFGWQTQQDDVYEDMGGFNFNMDLPPVTTIFFRFRDIGGAAPQADIRLTAAGKLQLQDNPSGNTTTSTATLSASTWYRIEWQIRVQSFWRIWLYDSSDALLDVVSRDLSGVGPLSQMHFGVITATANVPSATTHFYFDNMAAQVPYLKMRAHRMPLGV